MVPEYPIASSKLRLCFAKRFMYRIFTYENGILNSYVGLSEGKRHICPKMTERYSDI